MCKHRIEHGAKNNDADDNTDPQSHMMDLLDAKAHVGNARAHIERCGKRSVGYAPQNQDCQAALEPAGGNGQVSRRKLLEGFPDTAPSFLLQAFACYVGGVWVLYVNLKIAGSMADMNSVPGTPTYFLH